MTFLKIGGIKGAVENEKGSADGKMKILDGLRKELLKLIENCKYPKVEEELKEAF